MILFLKLNIFTLFLNNLFAYIYSDLSLIEMSRNDLKFKRNFITTVPILVLGSGACDRSWHVPICDLRYILHHVGNRPNNFLRIELTTQPLDYRTYPLKFNETFCKKNPQIITHKIIQINSSIKIIKPWFVKICKREIKANVKVIVSLRIMKKTAKWQGNGAFL